MTDQDATDCMALLVVAGTGWTDEVVDATIELMVRRWNDPEAAQIAVTGVADSWTGMGRPPWGVLNTAYQAAVRRAAMDRPQLRSGAGVVVSPAAGRKIAARAYASQCRTRDPLTDPHCRSGFRSVEPCAVFFDRILGLAPDGQHE